MQPDYQKGDMVLVNKLAYVFKPPKINEAIILKNPKDKVFIIKRINKIKNNKYFVLGDNSKESTDSRSFGWISKKEIVGKVI